MVKGPINQKITSLGETLWPVAWKQNLLVIYKEKVENVHKKR